MHDTLFKGACKFKDLDHYFGKKHLVSYYILEKNISSSIDIAESLEKDQYILEDYSPLMSHDKTYYIDLISKAKEFVKVQKIALWPDVFEKIDEIGE